MRRQSAVIHDLAWRVDPPEIKNRNAPNLENVKTLWAFGVIRRRGIRIHSRFSKPGVASSNPAEGAYFNGAPRDRAMQRGLCYTATEP